MSKTRLNYTTPQLRSITTWSPPDGRPVILCFDYYLLCYSWSVQIVCSSSSGLTGLRQSP